MTSPSADPEASWPKGKLPEPLDPLNPPPINQYCDLVLKGGVIDVPDYSDEAVRKPVRS